MMPTLIAATALSLALGGGGEPPRQHRPIQLEAEQVGDDIAIRVVGHAEQRFDGTYTLSVSSGVETGNRSVQRGVARMEAGQTSTFINLRLGRIGEGRWSAMLEVEPDGGDAYRIAKGAGSDVVPEDGERG